MFDLHTPDMIKNDFHFITGSSGPRQKHSIIVIGEKYKSSQVAVDTSVRGPVL